MPHLREIQLESGRDDIWPFTIPAFSNLHTLRLDAVTFFVGENGSGKSTLLEAIAQSAGSIAVGREDIERDETFSHLQPLVHRLKLRWSKRTRRGFFLRAEDFFGYARRLQSTKQ